MRHASKYQENINSSQVSLFENSSEVQFSEPSIPNCNEWDPLEKLAREKEVVGIYISGHPKWSNNTWYVSSFVSIYELERELIVCYPQINSKDQPNIPLPGDSPFGNLRLARQECWGCTKIELEYPCIWTTIVVFQHLVCVTWGFSFELERQELICYLQTNPWNLPSICTCSCNPHGHWIDS